MTMKCDGLNEAAPECYLEITPSDAQGIGVADGDMVEVKSRRGAITVKARVCDATEDGTVFLPFHYAQAAANKLTNTALDPIAAIPELKVCAVSVSRAA